MTRMSGNFCSRMRGRAAADTLTAGARAHRAENGNGGGGGGA